MINVITNKQKAICSTTITVMLLLSIISISSNFNYSQSAAAQNVSANNVGTFSASGYTGQSFILPQSITQTPPPASISQFNLLPPAGSIITGNWSFAVNGGKLQDFKWNVESLMLNGKVNGTASIAVSSNATGVVGSSTNNAILLSESNGTAFKANADININDRTAFYDVPIVMYLLNGKLINLSVDTVRTGGLFSTPLFGIATSLTR
jgi:hypothetical protein